MRYNDENENDLLGDISDLLSVSTTTETTEVEIEVVAEVEKEECVLIPLSYHIFTTHNGELKGKKEPIDTYKCDRVNGIIPIGKARIKADLMKKAFQNKTFFVAETSSKILPNGRVITVENIVYQTK